MPHVYIHVLWEAGDAGWVYKYAPVHRACTTGSCLPLLEPCSNHCACKCGRSPCRTSLVPSPSPTTSVLKKQVTCLITTSSDGSINSAGAGLKVSLGSVPSVTFGGYVYLASRLTLLHSLFHSHPRCVIRQTSLALRPAPHFTGACCQVHFCKQAVPSSTIWVPESVSQIAPLSLFRIITAVCWGRERLPGCCQGRAGMLQHNLHTSQAVPVKLHFLTASREAVWCRCTVLTGLCFFHRPCGSALSTFCIQQYRRSISSTSSIIRN